MRTVELLTLFARPASLWFCIVEAAPGNRGFVHSATANRASRGRLLRVGSSSVAPTACEAALPYWTRSKAAPGQALWRRVKSEVNILEVFPGRLSLFWLVPRTSRPPGAARRRMRAPNLKALACAKLRAGGASQRRPYGGVRAASHG